jgi:lipopolysaccharide transport protein LptA
LGADVVAHDSNAPISTQGDVLEGSLNKGKLILTGNVEIRQDDTLMKSDTAEVFSKAGTTTPERAVAKGRVSILKRPNPRVPEIRAVADELEYFVELLQGEVIELALDTGDIRIRSARSILDPRTQQEFSNSGGGNPK